MAIGTNAPPNDPTTGSAMWCDVTRACTGWYPAGSAQITAWDTNGYPTTVTGGSAAAWTYLYGYPTGNYALGWHGPQNGLTIQGKNITGIVADGSGGWIGVVPFSTGERCEFRSTGGVTGVHLLAPDAKLGQTFRDAFLALFRPYKVLRLMPSQRVNGIGLPPVVRTDWTKRTIPTNWDQTTNEVAAEHLAELCRESGCIPWVCLPYGATNDYITGLANAFAGFPLVYVEYSNELWNTAPAYQGMTIRNAAVAKGIYGTDPNVAGARYAADLTGQMGTIFHGVLGVSKVKVVFGGQETWEAWSSDGLKFLRPGFVDCLAVAPYFQCVDGDPKATVPQILASCQKWIDTILIPGLAANAKVAKAYGCEMIAYESGASLLPSMVNPPNIAIQPDSPAQLAAFAADPMVAAQNDSGMGLLHDNMFAACRNAGMTLVCHFMTISNWGRSGMWGNRQTVTDGENVKTQAVSRAIAAGN